MWLSWFWWITFKHLEKHSKRRKVSHQLFVSVNVLRANLAIKISLIPSTCYWLHNLRMATPQENMSQFDTKHSMFMQASVTKKKQQKKLEIHFSNSLIIHQEKRKKINSVTMVWICVPNYHKILPTLALNFSKNYWSFEKPYQTLESVSSDIQTPRSHF